MDFGVYFLLLSPFYIPKISGGTNIYSPSFRIFSFTPKIASGTRYIPGRLRDDYDDWSSGVREDVRICLFSFLYFLFSLPFWRAGRRKSFRPILPFYSEVLGQAIANLCHPSNEQFSMTIRLVPYLPYISYVPRTRYCVTHDGSFY